MAPGPIDQCITDVAQPRTDSLGLPGPALDRLNKAGIDLSNGYPYRPSRPLYLQDVYKIRNEERFHEDAGQRADKAKTSLFSAATKVTDLTTHIGTEIEGVQLKYLTNTQRDELALLIAERSVVFFRDQDITPQQQKELGKYYGEVEIHVSVYLERLPWAIPFSDRQKPASSPSGPRRPWRNSHLARPPSHRTTRELPVSWGRFPMAHGSCPRTATSRHHAPSQRYGPFGWRGHPVGKRIRGL